MTSAKRRAQINVKLAMDHVVLSPNPLVKAILLQDVLLDTMKAGQWLGIPHERPHYAECHYVLDSGL